jgi:cytochrome c-type biogenesis protein
MEPFLLISAFIAGIVMFLAPCTLPLLPAYLGFMSGVSHEELANPETKKRAKRLIVLNSAMFVLGFSLVFMLFGILAGLAGAYIGPLRHILTKVGGALLVVFGLLMVGVYTPSILTKERHVRMPKMLHVGTPLNSLLMGSAFAFGWTPCIGPILATVLLIASTTETVFSGALLLGVFCLGFGIPFVALAFLIAEASRFIRRIERYLRMISILGGVCLVFLGVFMMFGNIAFLTSWVFRIVAHLDYEAYLMRFL